MENLKELTLYLIILINAGGGARLLYCLIRVMGSPDELGSYLKKMSNVLIFLVLANSSVALMFVIRSYFNY